MANLKYRFIADFQLLFIRAEEIQGDSDRLRLLFAPYIRLGTGDSANTINPSTCAQFLGGVFRSKVPKKVLQSWKQKGLSIQANTYYQVRAAIDNFQIASDKGGASKDGLWFEILSSPEPLDFNQLPVLQDEESKDAA
jgi:hypothetical protein